MIVAPESNFSDNVNVCGEVCVLLKLQTKIFKTHIHTLLSMCFPHILLYIFENSHTMKKLIR